MTTEAQKIERANLYRTMMESWAWKDFMEIVNHERQNALEQAIIAPKTEDVLMFRGFVKCIDSILSEIDSAVNGR